MPVFDAGVVGDVYFIASGFIAGETMRAKLKAKHPFSRREAVQLIAKLAGALDYAHQQGIVHRDVKPENIILDASGEPHLLDFGLAQRDERDTLQTEDGVRMGTPAYMSPEQAGGQSRLADGRSDLWALGVMLYELLSGQRPFGGETTEVLLAILHHEPTPVRQRDRTISRDLETIVAKCLAKKPADRYATCGDLLRELECYLRGEPIAARPIGFVERTTRWCRREPRLAAAVGLSALSLLIAAGLGISLAVYQSRATAEQKQAAEKLTKKNAETQRALEDVQAARSETDKERKQALVQLAETRLAKARQLFTEDDPAAGQLWLCDALQAAEQAEAAELARVARLNLSAWQERSLPLAHLSSFPEFQNIALSSPDGKRLLLISGQPLVISGQPPRARVLDPANGFTETAQFQPSPMTRLAVFAPDSQRLATVSLAGKVEFWDVNTGKRIGKSFAVPLAAAPTSGVSPEFVVRVPLPTGIAKAAINLTPLHLAFSAAGDVIAVGAGSTLRLWSVESGQPLSAEIKESSSLLALGFEPQSQQLITLTNSGCRMWDAAQGTNVGETIPLSTATTAVALTPDGQSLITGEETEAVVWSVSAGEPLQSELQHTSPVKYVSLNESGSIAITMTADLRIHLWDVASGQLISPPVAAESLIGFDEPQLSPQNDFLAVPAPDGRSWKIWNAKTGQSIGQPLLIRGQTGSAAWTAEPTCFAVASAGGTSALGNVQAWQVTTPVSETLSIADPFISGKIACSLDGKWFAMCGSGLIRIWEVAREQDKAAVLDKGKLRLTEIGQPIREEKRVVSLAFHPQGNRLAVFNGGGVLRQYAIPEGKPIGGEMVLHQPRTGLEFPTINYHSRLAYSPDGRTLIASLNPGLGMAGPGTGESSRIQFQLWNAETCERIGQPILCQPNYNFPFGEDFFVGADSRFLCTSWRGQRQLCRLDTGEPAQFVPPAGSKVPAGQVPQFGPDGKFALWRAPPAGTLLQDLRSGEEVAWPRELQLEPSQRLKASTSLLVTTAGELVYLQDDQTRTLIWNFSQQRAVGRPIAYSGGVNELALSPDGTRILVRGQDGSTRLYDTQTGQPLGIPLETARANLYSHPSWSNFGDQLAGWLAPFSPDGKWIVTRTKNAGNWQLWDAATGQPIGPEQTGEQTPLAVRDLLPVAFSGGSDLLVQFDDFGFDPPQFYPLPQPSTATVYEIRRRVQQRVGLKLGAGGILELLPVRVWTSSHQPENSK